jgi:hypothetical protein
MAVERKSKTTSLPIAFTAEKEMFLCFDIFHASNAKNLQYQIFNTIVIACAQAPSSIFFFLLSLFLSSHITFLAFSMLLYIIYIRIRVRGVKNEWVSEWVREKKEWGWKWNYPHRSSRQRWIWSYCLNTYRVVWKLIKNFLFRFQIFFLFPRI